MKKLTPYIIFALILLALIWKSCEDARDKEIEIQMAERLILATEFYNEVLTQLENK